MLRRKLAVVCTHPIQYYSPVFRFLAQHPEVDLKVFYTWSQAAEGTMFDTGFGAKVKWDIPLLEGYAHQFVPNVAKRPGTHHFGGIRTPALTREIAAWEPDAVLVYTWSSSSHLRAMRHFSGKIPVLFRGDSTLLDERSWWRRTLRRAFLTWVYSHVDVAVAVGSNNRRYFEWCGMAPGRIVLAHHSVDTVRFASDSLSHDRMAAQWRVELGIPAEATIVLFAGKLQSVKSPQMLLEAFRPIKNGAHLVFIGNGELETGLRASAHSMKSVHFMPFQNQSAMPAVYRLGDIFVLPSWSETWGLALNEAMASGRAVIASSKVGAACDLIRPGQTGWIFESGDQMSLADVLRAAVASGRSQLHAMGRVAQAESVNWSSEASANRIAEAFLECIPDECVAVEL